MIAINLTGVFIDRTCRCYRVKLQRDNLKYRACVAWGEDQSAALVAAIAARDDFLRAIGNVQPRSNTGHLGITETTAWTHGHGRPCFYAGAGRRRARYFSYNSLATRETALAQALAWRAAQTLRPRKRTALYPVAHDVRSAGARGLVAHDVRSAGQQGVLVNGGMQ